jgi:hypothetical protein
LRSQVKTDELPRIIIAELQFVATMRTQRSSVSVSSMRTQFPQGLKVHKEDRVRRRNQDRSFRRYVISKYVES